MYANGTWCMYVSAMSSKLSSNLCLLRYQNGRVFLSLVDKICDGMSPDLLYGLEPDQSEYILGDPTQIEKSVRQTEELVDPEFRRRK